MNLELALCYICIRNCRIKCLDMEDETFAIAEVNLFLDGPNNKSKSNILQHMLVGYPLI